MNRLNVALGGHHLTADDHEWWFLQHTNVLCKLCETIGETALIISGCEISFSGANIVWTGGLIYLNGEVCEVVAGSAIYASNNTWSIVQSTDASGDQTYEDLNTEHPYLLRRGAISGSAMGPAYIDNIKKFRDYLLLEKQTQTDDLSFTLGTGWYLNTFGLFAWRSGVNEVMFDGKIEITSFNSTTNAVCLTLPTKFWPNSIYRVLAPAIIGGTPTVIHLQISGANGQITPIGLTNGQHVVIIFDGVRWPYWTV